MTERDRLEREIHQLTQIIAANAFALASGSTPAADRAGLQRQIETRRALRAGLLQRLSAASPGEREHRLVTESLVDEAFPVFGRRA